MLQHNQQRNSADLKYIRTLYQILRPALHSPWVDKPNVLHLEGRMVLDLSVFVLFFCESYLTGEAYWV
jgi:hypothetical protein